MPDPVLPSSFFPITSHGGVSYRILDLLGSGFNGEVYLVLATNGENRGLLFAMKVFVKIDDSTRLERFRLEVDFLSRVSHPSVLKVVDRGEVELDNREYPFAIFEYLPQTLQSAVKTGLSIVEKATFALQLVSGLSFLSRQNPQIVHRDIKPGNIFVRGRSCILGDFGLVKRLDGEDQDADREFMLETIGPAMPWAYRTPELVRYGRGEGDLTTTKSDVFQLGLVLAEMFSGRNPLKRLRAGQHRLDPIEMDESIAPIGGSQSAKIVAQLELMLAMSEVERPTADELFDGWDGILRSVVDISLDLEGKAFS